MRVFASIHSVVPGFSFSVRMRSLRAGAAGRRAATAARPVPATPSSNSRRFMAGTESSAEYPQDVARQDQFFLVPGEAEQPDLVQLDALIDERAVRPEDDFLRRQFAGRP